MIMLVEFGTYVSLPIHVHAEAVFTYMQSVRIFSARKGFILYQSSDIYL